MKQSAIYHKAMNNDSRAVGASFSARERKEYDKMMIEYAIRTMKHMSMINNKCINYCEEELSNKYIAKLRSFSKNTLLYILVGVSQDAIFIQSVPMN